MTFRDCPTCAAESPCADTGDARDALDAFRFRRARHLASGTDEPFAPYGLQFYAVIVEVHGDAMRWRYDDGDTWHRFRMLDACRAGDTGCGEDPCVCCLPGYLVHERAMRRISTDEALELHDFALGSMQAGRS